MSMDRGLSAPASPALAVGAARGAPAGEGDEDALIDNRGSQGSLASENRGSQGSLASENRGSQGSLASENRGSQGSLASENRGSQGSLASGALVGGYRVVRKIGEGGMGRVYEVQHGEVGQRAAVKVLRRQHSDSPNALQRFFNEARALGAVSDPGLIHLYDYGQLGDGTAYILMELLPGESLAQRVRALRGEGRGLTLPQVRDIIAQIAQTLAATHARGIIHRDLKPDNVFLCPDQVAPQRERAKVLDFGIAKFLSGDAGHQTTVGLILGTPTYMAPEQCEGQEGLSDRVDVYALGVMLYELCAGTPPFVAESGATVMRQHIFRPPPPLPEAAGAPAEVTALLTEMLAKEPTARPTMTAVAERLLGMRELSDAARPARAPRAAPQLPLSQIRTLGPEALTTEAGTSSGARGAAERGAGAERGALPAPLQRRLLVGGAAGLLLGVMAALWLLLPRPQAAPRGAVVDRAPRAPAAPGGAAAPAGAAAASPSSPTAGAPPRAAPAGASTPVRPPRPRRGAGGSTAPPGAAPSAPAAAPVVPAAPRPAPADPGADPVFR